MRILPSVALFSTFCLLTQAAPAADARRVDFGSLDDGTRIEAVEFSNGNGMRARRSAPRR